MSLPRTITLAAGSTIHASGNLLFILAAASAVDVTFGPDGAVARALPVGASLEVADGYNSITVSVACTLLIGHGRLFLPNPAAAGGTVPVPLPVQGVLPAFSQQAVGNFGNPQLNGMLVNNGDGTWTNYPLQSLDGQSLLVQPGHNSVAGFVANPGYSQPSAGLATIRVSIATPGGAAGLAITDQFGDPISVYPADGSAVLSTGVIPTSTGGRFYIPCEGTTRVLFNSTDATWGFRIGMSQFPFIPRLG